MPLTDLPIWNQLWSGEADSYGRLALALAAQLRTEDMDELIALADQGDEKQRRLAISVLLARNGQLRENPRFRPDQLGRLARVAQRYVKESFPFEPGCSFFVILSALEPDAAGDCIADLEIDDAWETPILMRVVSGMLRSKRSLVRLQQLSSRQDRIGAMATQYLELAGMIASDKLEELGAEFREKHTAQALNRIHSAYILHQVNHPLAPILKLLGEPTARRGNAYIYEAEGVQLYMEQDAEGNLSGLKIK